MNFFCSFFSLSFFFFLFLSAFWQSQQSLTRCKNFLQWKHTLFFLHQVWKAFLFTLFNLEVIDLPQLCDWSCKLFEKLLWFDFEPLMTLRWSSSQVSQRLYSIQSACLTSSSRVVALPSEYFQSSAQIFCFRPWVNCYFCLYSAEIGCSSC